MNQHQVLTSKSSLTFVASGLLALAPEVALINLDKLKWKLTQSSDATWDLAQFEIAEGEYRKFLSLKKWYPQIELVPTKLIDKVWHEHILDTQAYSQDCEQVFGYFLHHYPYFGIYGEPDQQNLQAAFAHSQALYQRHFGDFELTAVTDASQLEAMRCQGHACHAPTSCACRAPGACK